MIEDFIEHCKSLPSLAQQVITVCIIIMSISGFFIMKIMKALDDDENEGEIIYDEEVE